MNAGAASSTPLARNGAPATIFLSYSRVDEPRVMPLIAALESAGHAVWWDGLLQPGERFAETTAAALEQARAVLVCWSGTSVKSHWVHDEATRGRDRGCLLPVSLDGTLPPLGFGQFQSIDLSRARPGDASYGQVLAALDSLLDGTPKAPVARALAAPPRLDRRWLLAGGGVAVLAAGGGLVWQAGWLASPAAASSLAVLPFANLSGDPARDYFADGLAAEVRAELARNPRLQVAAQASSNRFRGRPGDARDIARQLGVAHLLDGNVRVGNGRVRVAAELIDGRSGFSVWTESYDRALADVFAVQDEIAGSVTAALVSRLFGRAQPRGRQAGGTEVVAAYDAWLRGIHLYNQALSEATDRAALAAFDAALVADPGYGLAHAGRSRALTVIANLYLTGTARRQAFADAIAAAREAVAQAPDSADAQAALGFALFNGALDARAARGPYDRAAALGQGDAEVLSRFGIFAARCGRIAEGRSALAKARRLDPLNARTAWLAGEVEYIARQYPAAIAQVERALALNPDLSVAWWALGAAQLRQGNIAAAAEAFGKESNSLFRLAGQAIVQQRQGDRAAARRSLAGMVKAHGDNALYQQAQVLAAWGDHEGALAALERARETGDAGIMYVRGDPLFDGVRGDPRFKRLLAALGFS
ncbi:TIR domain-containing protein [Sandarakinorhabdus rubra]|uniref:TIR domain-containing protein n=1 Tax=Sandarakinorhabdus rubra TaxID=2672568 RepID=UPI0022A74951|nr:TIR domain-containing protein [Sandarakinorhabdus rubra]